MTSMQGFKPAHFLWRVDRAVALIKLNRPEQKNSLTFASYVELRDTFQKLVNADDVHAASCRMAAIFAPAAMFMKSLVHWLEWR